MSALENVHQLYDIARYEAIKHRLLDEMTRSTFLQIVTVTAPSYETFTARKFNTLSWKDAVEHWLKDGSKFRSPGRGFDELPLADKIETALEVYFDELDQERSKLPPEPRFVLTSVAQHIFAKLHKARQLKEIIEISVPAGHGKTRALIEYQNQCRKAEGFTCHVWIVAMNTIDVSLKGTLYQIALALHSTAENSGIIKPHDRMTSIELARDIETLATLQPNGLLVLDEAQHICYLSANMQRPSGQDILNALRVFTDKSLFGIALMSNGEVYRRVTSKNGSPQLSSRIISEKIAMIKEDDIDLIMQAYGVSGKKERDWCVKVGMGEGGLRRVIKAFANIRYERLEITYARLNYHANERI
jgi:hypothetical protein